MHAYLQEIGGARMTNVNVAVEGDLLTIKVDLTAVAKDLSHQVEEWQQTAERTRTQCEQSEWYLGEAKASSARLEEERQALREAYGQLEAGHREVRAWLHEAERERDVAQEGLLQGTEYLGAQLVQAQGDVEEARRVVEDCQHQLSVERAQRTALEAELAALRTHGERRRALRTFDLKGLPLSNRVACLVLLQARSVTETGQQITNGGIVRWGFHNVADLLHQRCRSCPSYVVCNSSRRL